MPTALSNILNNLMKDYPEKILLGRVDYRPIYLSRPSFDCDWYWGFGYLGNKDTHYHLDGIEANENLHLFYKLKKHFGESLILKNDKDLWVFCEAVLTVYTLKKVADLFHRGGSWCTVNPAEKSLKKEDYYLDIIENLIPEQIAIIYGILAKYRSM